ncbi:MAG: autotransporter outer membrane beta-barrel domain-containing protein, partial [Puniceicoccales bacterium]|nr:autotransporter outer membrane beta-barrel domain-containing protein [Puniceicoccales bacterium]
ADLSHLSDFSNLSDDDIAFLEDLLNGKFCPYQHKLTSSRRLTSVNGELTSIDGELATISMAANTLVTDAVSRRMASVKGCLADPFIHALYGHSHGKESYGLGYSNNMGGFVVGADNVWTFTGERYVRLGAVLGYIHGKTKFFGPLADPITSTRHNICVLELFAAYESFNDNHLKTNIGLILGYNHGTDKLREGDPAVGDEKLRSNNVFLGLEFVKNLRSYNGFQFGPWLRANYGHIAQKAHEGPATIEHISTAHHNILVTVVGINVEKEILNRENPHKKATLSLKTGWECRPIHKHSHITASINDNTYEVVILQRPSKNSAVISFAASQKLDDHWSLVGSYTARFNKDVSAHNLSGGMEYSF